MTSQTILAQLQKAVPHFHLDPEWFEDNLTYPAINDFARYICSEAAVCSVAGIPRDDLHRAVTFLEEALRTGDAGVRDLVFECLETLRVCDSMGLVREYFGPKTQDLWAAFPP
jgi:hypothetical protein